MQPRGGTHDAQMQAMHPIHRLRELGQSAWLDFIDQRLLASGKLEQMVETDGLAGLTSNPTIFQKSIAASTSYDDVVRAASPSETDEALFEKIQVRDVKQACDLFRSLYEKTAGKDGLVSIEVPPALARDTAGSIERARRLWDKVNRRNVMVKIPGTREGLAAIETCLADGININITLLFSVARYVQVAQAYMRAQETRASKGEPIDRVASVASFFVSRVDTKVDKALDSVGPSQESRAKALRGQIAIANARVAYAECERMVEGDRFRRLEASGARRQRLLWASTSSKDPAYPDTYYVEALIAPHTVDTMTLETFRAYIDHGKPEVRLTKDGRAREMIGALAGFGIDFDRVADELENEGIRLFAESYDKAVASIAEKRRALGVR
jgi:transaldolase